MAFEKHPAKLCGQVNRPEIRGFWMWRCEIFLKIPLLFQPLYDLPMARKIKDVHHDFFIAAKFPIQTLQKKKKVPIQTHVIYWASVMYASHQPHFLCHSLRWRGKRPFCALGSMFPLCLLQPQNNSFSSIGALYFSPVFTLWISKWHLCEIMLSVRVNWQRSSFFFYKAKSFLPWYAPFKFNWNYVLIWITINSLSFLISLQHQLLNWII